MPRRVQSIVVWGALLAIPPWLAGDAPAPPGTVPEPPLAPAPGLVVPVTIVEVYDGDTLTVEITIRQRVRLLNCWAPEIRGGTEADKQRGLAARDYLREIALGRPALLSIPARSATTLGDLMSFERVLGMLWIEHDGRQRNLAELLREAGHATWTREGP